MSCKTGIYISVIRVEQANGIETKITLGNHSKGLKKVRWAETESILERKQKQKTKTK
jgi:hypothetical protein